MTNDGRCKQNHTWHKLSTSTKNHSFCRAGKLCDFRRKQELCDALDNSRQVSQYCAQYTTLPSHDNLDNRKGGGYWLFERQAATSAPLRGQSTYATDICAATDAASKALAPTEGLKVTVIQYEQARRRAKATGGPERGVQVPITSKGDVVGYTTTYRFAPVPSWGVSTDHGTCICPCPFRAVTYPDCGRSVANAWQPRSNTDTQRLLRVASNICTPSCSQMVLKDPLTGGSAAAGAPRTTPPLVPLRYANLPRAMPPRTDGVTSYSRDMGPPGGDPVVRLARTVADMKGSSTTKELAAGSQSTTWHIPGYTGFQCATVHNPHAVAHSLGKEPRKDNQVWPDTVAPPHQLRV
jgi:hypothetical protein